MFTEPKVESIEIRSGGFFRPGFEGATGVRRNVSATVLGDGLAIGGNDDESRDSPNAVFLGKRICRTGAMGHGIPLHSRFLHVVHLVLGATVGTHEYDFEVFLVCVAELDEFRSETAAWRAPMSREIDSDGFAGQGVLGNFGSFCVEEGTLEQVGGA